MRNQDEDETRLARDRELIEAVRSGCSNASRRLVDEHSPRMRALARRMLRDEVDTEEVVQDALLAAFRNIDGFRGDSRLSTWLHRITTNAALMRLRKRRRTREVPAGDLSGENESDARTPGASRDPETLYSNTQLHRRMLKLAAQLPEPHRTVLWLRDVCELETRQVARQLGTTDGAVKTRLHRARAALRRALEAEETHGALPA